VSVLGAGPARVARDLAGECAVDVVVERIVHMALEDVAEEVGEVLPLV
jgi:hypothetical protein